MEKNGHQPKPWEKLCSALKSQDPIKQLLLYCENFNTMDVAFRLKGKVMENNETDKGIGEEGARELSEALKTNTTLQTLHLWGKEEREEAGWITDITKNTNTNKQTTTLEQKEQKH